MDFLLHDLKILILCFISFQLFMNSLVKHTNTWAKLQITTG